MTELSPRLKRQLFWRSLFLQVFWNYERMQGLGFAFAIAPALRKAHPDAAAFHEALKRHSGYFNTQPYMAGFILGVVARLESDRHAAKDEARITAIKTAMASALAGIGDALFWGTLRPFCAILALGVWLTLAGAGLGGAQAMAAALLAYLLAFNIPAMIVRWQGLSVGYAAGDKIVDEIKRFHWQERIRWLRRAGRTLAVVITLSALVVPGWGWDKAVVYAAIFAAALSLKTYRWSAAQTYGLFAVSGMILSFIIR